MRFDLVRITFSAPVHYAIREHFQMWNPPNEGNTNLPNSKNDIQAWKRQCV